MADEVEVSHPVDDKSVVGGLDNGSGVLVDLLVVILVVDLSMHTRERK